MRYTQYSALRQGSVWELSAFGPDGIERLKFDSLAAMTAWVGAYMAETDEEIAA